MNINQEYTPENTIILTVSVSPEDYHQPVDNALKKYRRQANVPGFRPGNVPASMIKKMYGKSVLVDELNNLLSETLQKYIVDKKLDTLGNPLPLKSEREQLFEEGQSFEFKYELAPIPEFVLSVSEKDVLPYYLIEVNDKMVDDEIADLRSRFGQYTNPEVSSAGDILYGEFEELDETGNPKPDGNKTTTTLALELISNEEEKQKFIGLKKEDAVVFSPMKAMNNETEVAAMLKTDKNAPSVQSDYRFTVKTINQLQKAEIGQELFDKVFEEGVVTSEEEFREKVREKIGKYFEYDSERKVKKDLKNYLLEKVAVPLPVDFLKRLLRANVEKPIDDHRLEHEFFHFAEDLRWDMIRQRVVSENRISVTEKEVLSLAESLVRSQFARYGMYDLSNIRLDELAQNYIKKDENRSQLHHTLLEDKALTVLKSRVTLNTTTLPYEEFMSKMLEKTAHEAEHHHH